jgi:hypothetical protein
VSNRDLPEIRFTSVQIPVADRIVEVLTWFHDEHAGWAACLADDVQRAIGFGDTAEEAASNLKLTLEGGKPWYFRDDL